MKFASKVIVLAVAGMLVAPSVAFASASDSLFEVPGWLSMGGAGLGLVIGTVVLVQATMLRRVAAGSILASNIAFVVLAVLCLAVSMLVRWIEVFVQDAHTAEYVAFGADLMVVAGVALVAVYLTRVRSALSRYARSVETYAAAGVPEENGEVRG